LKISGVYGCLSFFFDDNDFHIFLFLVEVKVGNLVIGKQTFDHFQTFTAEGKYFFKVLRFWILVLSKVPAVAGYTFFSSPAQAIAYMKAKGVSELAIGGGVGIFNAFID